MQRHTYKGLKVTSSVKRCMDSTNKQYHWNLNNRGRKKDKKFNTQHSQKKFHHEFYSDFKVK